MYPLLRSTSLLSLPATIRSTITFAALYPFSGTPASSQSPPISPVLTPQLKADRARLHYSTMASSAESTDDVKSSGQKPMLARQRAKDEAEPKGQPPIKPGYFPLGYREGFSQWWTSLAPAVTEHRVMSFIPFLQKPPTHTHTGTQAATADGDGSMPIDKSPDLDAQPTLSSSTADPHGPRVWNSTLVQLSGKDRALNELSVSRPGEEAQNSLVMLHGYGAGLGFFYKNFEPLSRLAGWKLYALDLLGMGRSSRPPFKILAKEKEDKVREAENWFIDALEEWRVKRGIDKMTLLGHSLGGYLAVCYALKYPGHLNKLVLASPVGIPEDPYAVNEEMPEPKDSTVANEFSQSQHETTGDDRKRDVANGSNKPPPRRMPRWVVTLWDANVSPFSLVRLAGPLGPRLVSGWTSRRFSHLPGQEAQALHDYSYSLFRQRGSGEYALTYILAPGAFARSPLIRRIQGIGRQLISPSPQPSDPSAVSHGPTPVDRVRETGVPVVMLYGDHDWMDVDGGHAAAEKLNEEHRKALAAASDDRARQSEVGGAKVVVVKNAGHHVYLDGFEQFNDTILDEMRDVERVQQRQARLEE